MELVNLVFNTCSVIYLVILQQLEGNLIYPRVVGSSLGLPAIWVLAAVTIGGGVMGVTGMLIGVSIIDMVSIPDNSIILVRLVNLCLLFSVFYRLLNKYKILRVYRLRETEVKVVNDNQSKD